MGINERLLDFIEKSPTAFHAISEIAARLTAQGFRRLGEGERWELTRGGDYFVTRNDSSIIAFRVGGAVADGGFIAAASHSDSPTFKLKHNFALNDKKPYLRVAVEKYGGGIYASWLDRPLTVAGRMLVKNESGIETRLVHIDRDLLLIPNVAIHMNREINKSLALNEAVDMVPLYAAHEGAKPLAEVFAESIGVKLKDITAYELCLVPRTKGVVWGDGNEFISAPRLDDLQCAFATLEGFLNGGNDKTVQVYCCFDSEEIGSETKQGAASTFLADTLRRVSRALGRSEEEHLCALANSFMLSADNAHAVHPNHPEHTDSANQVRINGGVAVKVNAAYSTDGMTNAIFRELCARADVPVQSFANRSDKVGGSTLGNIASTQVSVRMVDVGLGQLAMHSCYETAGTRDTEYLARAAKTLYDTAIFERTVGQITFE